MARMLFISDNFINESLGIMCLSSYLKANGHDVTLTLLSEYRKIDGLLKFIKDASPDLIGFSVMTPQVNTFRHVAKIIKEATRHTVIWGGAHCIFMSEEVLKSGCADIICVGEGEESLLTLMNRIDADEAFDDIPNLWIRKKDAWIKNSLGNLEPNLDKYPFPDRGLYYDKYPLLRNFALKRLMTQRGCPYDCSYCFEPTFKEMYKGKGKLVRRHSVEYAIDEIKTFISKYPTKSLHFSDDTFNLNKDWVISFLSRYEKEICLPFTCNISVLGMDDEIIQKMKDSGCRGVFFGLENGREEARFNILNKKIPNEKYISISKLLRKHKIKFIPNLLFCLPKESIEDAIESIRFTQLLKPYGTKTSILKIYKGTKLAKFLLDNELCEAEGEFLYKPKDIHHDYGKIKNMIWAAYLFIKFPLLLRFAKKIVSMPVSFLFTPLVLLNHLQDIMFFKIPISQALEYFWHSRKVFTKGITAEQIDVYKSLNDSSK